MGTVFRTATHPETGDKYQIELPDPAVIRQAILELPCPPNGMMPKETSKRLAEKLKLSEEQKNAVNPSGESIFWYMVAEGFSYLLQTGKLKQPGGPRTPYFLVDEPTTPDQIELPASAVVRQAITDLSRASAKLNEIAEKSADGDYIYRGESKTLEKVRSSLYSEYEADIEAENFDIAVVQAEILKEAKKYTTHKMDDPEILAELQHHGGKTNLIDFTEDYRVALFFACDSNRDKPGRVILLKKESEDYEVLKPPGTVERAGVQKSIFVQSPSGVVEPDTVVDIPADLKVGILDHLQKHHHISTKTIYNDLQGFIENRRIHKSAYTEFHKGFTCQDRGDLAKDPAEKQEWYDKAIGHYTEAIDLKPELTEAHTNRDAVYRTIGDFEIKQRFAVETKPVVLTEGKTDARYIRTALKLFGEEELLNSLEIRPVGKEGTKGDKGGGQTGLDNYHKFYRLHSRSFKHATLLLYDSDVIKIPEPVEKPSVKRIQENPENTKVTKGIENLFPEELFEERFYDETVIKKEDGGQVTKSELNKTKFCDWICENGTATDFAKFDSVVQILKEFVEAN